MSCFLTVSLKRGLGVIDFCQPCYRILHNVAMCFSYLITCRFKVNFGQMDAWYPPPKGFKYIGQLPLTERVRGMIAPASKSDCEVNLKEAKLQSGKNQINAPHFLINIIVSSVNINLCQYSGLK